jgi:hypothetical protein
MHWCYKDGAKNECREEINASRARTVVRRHGASKLLNET